MTSNTPDAPAASAAADQDDDGFCYPSVTAIPRLGRGVVWADVLADMEGDNLRRKAA